MTILEEQTECKPLAKVLGQVRSEVEGGKALSDALAVHPKVFPPLMVNMCRAGEVGGFLDQSLLQIASNYEAEVRLRGKVKSAMTYPRCGRSHGSAGRDRDAAVHRPHLQGDVRLAWVATLPAPTRLLVLMSELLKSSIVFIILFLVIARGAVEEVQAHRPGPRMSWTR